MPTLPDFFYWHDACDKTGGALPRALVEATAYGTRIIVENFIEHGVPVEEFYAAGGIAEKDPFTMQLYSDVLGMEIKISGSPQVQPAWARRFSLSLRAAIARRCRRLPPRWAS